MVENICKLAENLKSGEKSFSQLVGDSGWRTQSSSIPAIQIYEYLKNNLRLIDSWLLYSMNKRSSEGWYFSADEETGEYIVGFYDKCSSDIEVSKSRDRVEACVKFIINELNAVVRSIG